MLSWPSELLAQRTVPCDSVRGNEQDSVSETPGDTPSPLAAWALTSCSTVPHTWLTIAPNPCFTPPVTSQGLLPCQCFESSPEQLEVTLGRGQTDAYETLLFALQTKKYADVIIPRGVDNMGKNQANGLPDPSVCSQSHRASLPCPSVVTEKPSVRLWHKLIHLKIYVTCCTP